MPRSEESDPGSPEDEEDALGLEMPQPATTPRELGIGVEESSWK